MDMARTFDTYTTIPEKVSRTFFIWPHNLSLCLGGIFDIR